MFRYSIGSDVWPGMSKLIEEMGEVQQVLGKLIATGGQEDHWDGSDLREKLLEELPDLMAAVLFFAQNNGLTGEEFTNRYSEKFELFKRWHEEQKQKPEYREGALLQAAKMAWWHLDCYGIVSTQTLTPSVQDQVDQQTKVLAALSPFGRSTTKPEGL